MSSLDAEAIQLFARPAKRERLLFLCARKDRRSDFIHAFLHDRRSIDPDCLVALPKDADSAEGVLRLLPSPPTTRAYCICSHPLDGHETTLREALAGLFGAMEDAMVLCVGQKAAYYENHEGEQFIARVKGQYRG